MEDADAGGEWDLWVFRCTSQVTIDWADGHRRGRRRRRSEHWELTGSTTGGASSVLVLGFGFPAPATCKACVRRPPTTGTPPSPHVAPPPSLSNHHQVRIGCSISRCSAAASATTANSPRWPPPFSAPTHRAIFPPKGLDVEQERNCEASISHVCNGFLRRRMVVQRLTGPWCGAAVFSSSITKPRAKLALGGPSTVSPTRQSFLHSLSLGAFRTPTRRAPRAGSFDRVMVAGVAAPPWRRHMLQSLRRTDRRSSQSMRPKYCTNACNKSTVGLCDHEALTNLTHPRPSCLTIIQQQRLFVPSKQEASPALRFAFYATNTPGLAVENGKVFRRKTPSGFVL